MKKLAVFLLCLCLVVSGVGCTQRNGSQSTPEPQSGSASAAVSEKPSAPEETSDKSSTPAESAASSQAEVSEPESKLSQDEAFYQDILLTYGGEMSEDMDGNPCLRPTMVSLFFSDGWDNSQELGVYSYYSWYLSMMWKEDTTFEERQEKYKSPFGENTGWFFPQDLYEPLVQRYFDVSTEYLRSNPDLYSAEYKGYHIGGGGGRGEGPSIILDKTERQNDLLMLYMRLEYKYQDVESRILTVRLEPDGGYKFVSYK